MEPIEQIYQLIQTSPDSIPIYFACLRAQKEYSSRTLEGYYLTILQIYNFSSPSTPSADDHNLLSLHFLKTYYSAQARN